MNYSEALEFIHSKEWLGPKRPLEDTRKMLDDLGAPDRKMKIVHVAGTNGKGSTSAFIESILREAGYRTGLFTSPYITRFNERIRVNGEDIPDDVLAGICDELRAYILKSGIKPKEFELVTVIGLLYFAREGCDFAVLEVGMGGTYDYTNVIDSPELAVITSIGLDHTKQLGSTVEEIASVKAGIIKSGCDVVAYKNGDGVNRIFSERCTKVGARLFFAPLDDVCEITPSLCGCSFSFGSLGRLETGLAGVYQPYNAALAACAARILSEKGYNITDGNIKAGLRKAVWRGRFEPLMENPVFILDGAHNPQAVDATLGSLRANFKGKKFTFVVGFMADKDVDGIAEILVPASEHFCCVPIDYPRAMGEEACRDLFMRHGGRAESFESVDEGVKRAIELAGDDGVVCAIGSLYLSQPVREAVERHKNSREEKKTQP